MNTEKLLKTLPLIQNQLDALLDFDVCASIIFIIIAQMLLLHLEELVSDYTCNTSLLLCFSANKTELALYFCYGKTCSLITRLCT